MPVSSSRSAAGRAVPAGEGEPVAPVQLLCENSRCCGRGGNRHDSRGDANIAKSLGPRKERAHSPFSDESGVFATDEMVSSGGRRHSPTGCGGSIRETPRDAAVTQEALDTSRTEMVEVKRDNAVMAYLKRLKGAGKPGPVWFAWSWDTIPAFAFSAITLMILAVIEGFGLQPYNKGLLAYLPSFGASCCLVMCLLTAPGAQPRALVLTHICGAFLGVSWGHITADLFSPLDQQLTCAFAVAILAVLMLITGTMQPSAAATTCLAAFHRYGQMNDKGFMFIVAPATVGPCVIVFLGWLLNNLIPWRHCYPIWL